MRAIIAALAIATASLLTAGGGPVFGQNWGQPELKSPTVTTSRGNLLALEFIALRLAVAEFRYNPCQDFGLRFDYTPAPGHSDKPVWLVALDAPRGSFGRFAFQTHQWLLELVIEDYDRGPIIRLLRRFRGADGTVDVGELRRLLIEVGGHDCRGTRR